MRAKYKNNISIGSVIITLDKDKALKSESGYLILYNGIPKEIKNLELTYTLFKGALTDTMDYQHTDYITEALYKVRGTQGLKTVTITYTI